MSVSWPSLVELLAVHYPGDRDERHGDLVERSIDQPEDADLSKSKKGGGEVKKIHPVFAKKKINYKKKWKQPLIVK